MGKGTIGSKIVLEGEKSYREALKSIKTEQAELRSEMKLCQSSFKENQNSADALGKKYEILTKQMDTQTNKVELYQKAVTDYSEKQERAADKIEELRAALSKAETDMKQMSESSDKSSEAISEQAKTVEELKKQLADAEKNYTSAGQKVSYYQTNVNNAKAELAAMENELQKTGQYMKEAESSTDKCATSIDNFGREIQENKAETLDYGDVLKANLASDLIAAGIKNLGDLFKNLATETVEAAKAAAAYADEIGTLSVQTGIATDTLQALTYAEELMDVSVSTVTSSMAKNIRSMNSAREGTEAYAEAYEKLGVEIVDTTTNELRDSETVFWEVVDALGEIDNASERDAVAMQLFGRSAQQLNTLVEQGSEGFQKFKQEAIDAGYVLEEDTFNALLDTSDAMERVSKKTDALKRRIGAELSPQITKFSTITSNALDEMDDKLVDLASGGFEKLVDGVEWLLDNSDLVIAGISGMTAATVYHGAVAPLITSVTTAWNTYKTANEGATVSQWLLNAAMDANPAGMLITGIVGLTAALAAFVITADSNTVVLDETTQKTKELVQQSKELNDTYTASSAERAASRQEMETEAGVCKKLVQELTSLQSKTTLTTQEQARQKAIVEQLNQAMPELNLAIDEQTSKLNMSTQELEKNVEASLALAKVEVERGHLIEIAEKQLEAEKQLAELEEQRVEQVLQVKSAQKDYNDLMEQANENALGYTATLDAMGGAESTLSEKVNQAKTAQEELDAQIAATRETIAGYTEEYEETLNYISDTEPIASASEAMSGLGDSAAATGENISGLSAIAQQAFSDMYTSVSDSIASQMDLFTEWDAAMVASGEQMVANMQSQVNGLQEWADNIQELADRGINQGLLQKLADMGPEGAGYVAAFVDMTDEELQRANELYAESFTLSDDVATQIAESYAGVGESAIKGMTDKISESSETVKQSGIDTGETLQSGVEEKLEIDGESKVFANIGISSIQGLITGVKGEEANATNTAQNLAGNIVTTSQTELKTSTFSEIGKQIPAGLVQGINSGQSAVINAVVELCTKAVETSKSSLDIHSPSRISRWMGEMYTKGLADGITENTKLVTTAVNSMCTKAIDSTNAALSNRNIEAELSAITHTQAVISAATNDRMQHSGQSIIQNSGNKTYNIDQTFQIYGETSDLIETSRQYRDIMREVAKEW